MSHSDLLGCSAVHRMSPTMCTGWMKLWKGLFIFFYSMPSRFPFFSSHSFPWHHAEWLSGAAWRLICSHVKKSSIPQSHHPPSYSFSPSIIFLDTVHNFNCAMIFNIIPPCRTKISLACISILLLNFVLEHVMLLRSVISKLWDMLSLFGLLHALSAVTNNCWAAAITAADCHAEHGL